MRNRDELDAHPDRNLRCWIKAYIILNAPDQGPGILYHTRGSKERGLLIPVEDYYDVILAAHSSSFWADGHAGRRPTHAAIQASGKWCQRTIVEEFLKLCPVCRSRQQVGKDAMARSVSGASSSSNAASPPGPAILPSTSTVLASGQDIPSSTSSSSNAPSTACPTTLGSTPFPRLDGPARLGQASPAGSLSSGGGFENPEAIGLGLWVPSAFYGPSIAPQPAQIGQTGLRSDQRLGSALAPGPPSLDKSSDRAFQAALDLLLDSVRHPAPITPCQRDGALLPPPLTPMESTLAPAAGPLTPILSFGLLTPPTTSTPQRKPASDPAPAPLFPPSDAFLLGQSYPTPDSTTFSSWTTAAFDSDSATSPSSTVDFAPFL